LSFGAIIGVKGDYGTLDEFIKRVGQALGPTSSAILVLIQETDYEGAIAYLQIF